MSPHPFFKDIKIEELEAELRNMLLTNDASDDQAYRICAIAIQKTDSQLLRLVVNPHVREMPNGGKMVIFHINGIIYFIDLKPKSDFIYFDVTSLKKSGELTVALLEGIHAHDMLKAFNIPMPATFLEMDNKLKLKGEVYKIGLEFIQSKNPRELLALKTQLIEKVISLPYSPESKTMVNNQIRQLTKNLNAFFVAIRARNYLGAANLKIENTLRAFINIVDLCNLPKE